MGSRGPVPKRQAERRRRNKDQQPASTSVPVEPPRSGKGSSAAAWRAYAAALGVEIDPGAKRADVIAAIDARAAADPGWHQIATRWFEALARSGQSRFFEPSDWEAARFVAEIMTRNLDADEFTAAMFAAVWSAMNELLTTEGARRRVRMEIEREQAAGAQPDPSVAMMAEYRKRLAEGT